MTGGDGAICMNSNHFLSQSDMIVIQGIKPSTHIASEVEQECLLMLTHSH